HRAELDQLEYVGVEERDVQRYRDGQLAVARRRHLDALRLERGQGARGVPGGVGLELELTVYLAVRPVPDGRELVRQRGPYVGVVPGVLRQRDAHRGQELVVRHVLLLGDDDPPRDVELLLLRQRVRQQADDPVVLTGEERVGRGEPGVLVGPDVTGDHRLGVVADQP